MKCDNLIHEVLFEGDPINYREHLVYAKTDVDEAIAELKAENDRLRGESYKLTDGCLRLKQCRNEKVNLADDLRATKRALWMARAERAQERKTNKWLFKSYIKSHKSSWFIDGNEIELAWDLWKEAFDRVEKICRKTAEEYK